MAGRKIGMCLLIGSLLLTLPTAATASGALKQQRAVPVLTYHPGYSTSSTYETSNLIAFREDLRMLDRLGFQIVPLSWVVEWVLGGRAVPPQAVALTFDDGADSTYLDSLDADGNPRPSFLKVLEEFQAEVGVERQPYLHLTVFVIASSRAREEISQEADVLNDYWWRAAQESPLIDLGNHSWDHNHQNVQVRCDQAEPAQQGFLAIDTYAEAMCEVAHAAAVIHRVTGLWPTLFAYPYGQSSDYLRDEYFPEFLEQHRTQAAFGTEARPVTRDSSRWNLPRYVYGADWLTPAKLQQILADAR